MQGDAIPMIADAYFSDCGRYRYDLYRMWDADKPMAMCIGLNPSTGNREDNDATIRRLINLLQANGYGGFHMANVYALISTDPDALTSHPNPTGDNDVWLHNTRMGCRDVIFCWGNFRQAQHRGKKLAAMWSDGLCFGRNRDGSPKHPLYLKADTKLVKYTIARGR